MNSIQSAATLSDTLRAGSYPAWGTFIIACLGFAGIIARQFVPWLKQRDDSDASLRGDLMKLLHDNQVASSVRITELERALVDERVRCAGDMTAMQHRHDEQIANLHGEIKGLRDNLIQQGRSASSMITLGANAPISLKSAIDKLDEQP